MCQIFLRFLYRGRRRVLSYIVQKPDLVKTGILCEDQIHYRLSVEEIGRSGHVSAGLFKRFDESRGQRIRHRGEHDRGFRILRRRLHRYRDGCRHADHEVDLLSLEVCDDLRHDVCVRVAVLLRHLYRDVVFLSDLFERGFDVRHYLIERGVVDVVADADRVFSLFF